MAYGTQVYHWRSYGNWSTSISGRNFKVTLTVGMGSVAWGYNLGVIANANIDGTTNSIRSNFYSATGATVDKNMLTISKTFTRGHSNVNKGLSWSIVNGSGYHNGTSTGSGTVTVPAVASHTVTFDDNGGSEGPESTVKWEYESLTIPSKIPTRKNYKFLGWSSSSNSASAEYEAGKSYDGTKDENYTLYAVWKILYIPPSFSNALALRTASASSTTNDPDGAYCYASFTWNVDTSVYPDNVLNAIDIKYYQDDSTIGTDVTPSGITSGATGTVNVHFPASLSSVYSIVCAISDTQGGSVSIARSIGSGSIPIEVSNNGHSIGIMSSAPISPGVKIGSSGTPSFEHLSETINGNLNSVARIYGETSSDGQGKLTLSTDGFDQNGNPSSGEMAFNASQFLFNSYKLDSIMTAPAYDGNKPKPSSPQYLRWGVIRLPNGLCVMSALEDYHWTFEKGVRFCRAIWELPIPLLIESSTRIYNIVYSQMMHNTLDYCNQISVQTEKRETNKFCAVSWHTSIDATFTYIFQPIVIGRWK